MTELRLFNTCQNDNSTRLGFVSVAAAAAFLEHPVKAQKHAGRPSGPETGKREPRQERSQQTVPRFVHRRVAARRAFEKPWFLW